MAEIDYTDYFDASLLLKQGGFELTPQDAARRDELLRHLKSLALIERAVSVAMQRTVDLAIRDRATWREVGDAYGVTDSTAHQRWRGRRVDDLGFFDKEPSATELEP